MTNKEVATQFGNSLDKDEYHITRSLLALECQYFIGTEKLTGPKDICHSYESNMIEGRKKLDKLEWGQSVIEAINDSQFYVHFTDYLTHKGKDYVHKCKQKLTLDSSYKIIRIDHVADAEEQESLNNYYKSVGLK